MTTVPLDLDIVVPVYNAPDDLRRCVDSVLAHAPRSVRIVLIDDASPHPGVRAIFAELAARADPRVELLRNARNLGFTGTANAGMRRSRADVVLLNSDAIVTPGAIEALAACAASDPRIATVTPFSNNAEICSFPRFCENNACDAVAAARIARALRASAVPSYPDLPTGVGFCMLVRRAAIDAIGVFDPAFGAGYGEENDFCLRAARAGLRNVLADDAFVVHTGGRSFEGRKEELGARNLALLSARHPHYEPMVRDYIAADPLRAIRDAACARLASEDSPGVLHLVRDADAGAAAQVRSLIDAAGDGLRHLLALVHGASWRVEEHAFGETRCFDFARHDDEDEHAFAAALAATFRVSRVREHRAPGAEDVVLGAAAAPLANERIRDALGYRAWSPPAVAAHAQGAATPGGRAGWRTRVARRALAMRGTPFGRLLYRMTPAPVIDALKARL